MTESTIALRTAGPADIPAIQGLADRIWRQHYPGIITIAQIEYMLERMYATEVIEDEMVRQGYRYTLAVERTEPIGFIAYRFEERDRSVKISKLYLLPSRHGQGIGRQMLGSVRDQALRLGARKLLLFVNKANRKAIRAYERFGFVKAADAVTDIGGGFVMDDYAMELALEG
jgi:GNAT superfamily N-acetyltransferase